MTRLLVLSATASAINYIKSLGPLPEVDLHVTDADPYCPGLYDPHVTPHVVPLARDTAAYRQALDTILRRHRVDALIPTSDYDVEAISAWLSDGWTGPETVMFRNTVDQCTLLSDTARLMQHLQGAAPELCPRTAAATDELSALRLPVVVKPLNQSGGRGIRFAETPAELGRAIEDTSAAFGAGNYVVQEFIPGRTYVATMVCGHDRGVVAAVGMRSTRTFFTWGGGGSAGELVDEPELLRLSERVLDVCGGWSGPINLEWRRRPDTGAFYLMEVNCRLNGYGYLATMNGIDLPKITLATLLGTDVPQAVLKKPFRNFVLGYRETAVAEWIGEEPARRPSQ